MDSKLVRFTLVGVVGFVVDIGVLEAALRLGAGYFIGRLLSFLSAVWVTWQLNKRLTFSGSRTESPWRQWWRYLAAMSFGGALNYGVYSAVVLSFPRLPYVAMLGVALGSLSGLLANFTSARWWVFRHRA
ncbi:GtrA family protein [Burkholderia diffusa]|uniref:GtrA family protein n=1 Tax=Burkholderia diffusa TaxID=488732 RepID=UPI00075A0CC7|nr:GtrA family protein [Burkholderia diffusa]KVH51156.1 polysaccharide synthesis protein GtrA [Burkholderia diffusa]